MLFIYYYEIKIISHFNKSCVTNETHHFNMDEMILKRKTPLFSLTSNMLAFISFVYKIVSDNLILKQFSYF